MARPPSTSRERIDAVALELFLQRGFARVTAEQVARAVGISRPTLFRYAPQLADIVLDQVAGFAGLTVAELRRAPGSHWDALSRALVEPYRGLDEASPMGQAFVILAREPDLRGRSGLMARAWRAALAGALAERGLDDPILSQAYAGSAIGIVTAAFAGRWPADTLATALARCTPAP